MHNGQLGHMQPAGAIYLVSHDVPSRSLPILALPPLYQRHLHPKWRQLSKTRCRERSQTGWQPLRLPSCKERPHTNQQKPLWKRCEVGYSPQRRTDEERKGWVKKWRREVLTQPGIRLQLVGWKWERSGNKGERKQWKAGRLPEG